MKIRFYPSNHVVLCDRRLAPFHIAFCLINGLLFGDAKYSRILLESFYEIGAVGSNLVKSIFIGTILTS